MKRRAGLRWHLLVFAVLLAISSIPIAALAQVKVRGYYRKDGTYVRSHYRSSPDGNFWNNWSTKGNVNPYTGKEGTRVTPPLGSGSYTGGSYVGTSSPRKSYVGGYASANDDSGWLDNPHYAGIAPGLRTTSEATDDTLRIVAEMNYHGIGFSTTHQDFLSAFPQAKPAAPVDSAGVISYAIEDIDGKRDVIWFQFVDDQFLRLVFAYGETRVLQYGGTKVLSDRARQKFGPATQEDSTTAVWLFPAVDRLVMTHLDGRTWYLVVTRLSLQQSINATRAEIDVGF